MEEQFNQYFLSSIDRLAKAQEQAITRLLKVSKNVEKVKEGVKNTKLDLENVKEETKLFPSILSEVLDISEVISECCSKIMKLDRLITTKTSQNYKKEVAQHEESQLKSLNDEEQKLQLILKDLKLQICDMKLQQSLINHPSRPQETQSKGLKDIKAIHDKSSLDDFLND